MTRSIDKNALFMGERLITAREVIRQFNAGKRDPVEIGKLASVKLDGRVVAAMIEEMKRRELIIPFRQNGPRFGSFYTDWNLSEAGKALATATAGRRVPIEKGQELLEGLLKSCEAVNADPEQPYHVDEVWLFGSMLGNGPDIGDVDVVVTRRFSPKYAAIDDAHEAHEKAREFAWQRVPQSSLSTIWGQVTVADTLFQRMVFGARRHPLLSAKQADLDDLKKMGCPCRLVFASARGGRVNDPRLPHHPDADGDAVRPEVVEIPDLHAPVAAPRTPVSLSGLAEFGEDEWDAPFAFTRLLPHRSSGQTYGWDRLYRHPGVERKHWADPESAAKAAARLGGFDDVYLAPEIPVEDGKGFTERTREEHLARKRFVGGIGISRKLTWRKDKAELRIRFEACRTGRLVKENENAMADFILFVAASDVSYLKLSHENSGEPVPKIKLSFDGVGKEALTEKVLSLVKRVTETYPDWAERKEILSRRERDERRNELYRQMHEAREAAAATRPGP